MDKKLAEAAAEMKRFKAVVMLGAGDANGNAKPDVGLAVVADLPFFGTVSKVFPVLDVPLERLLEAAKPVITLLAPAIGDKVEVAVAFLQRFLPR